jgi:DNA-binding transcriptional ArsR family regulator
VLSGRPGCPTGLSEENRWAAGRLPCHFGEHPLRTLQDITDPRLVKALAHPLRIKILAILEERVASPSQIAEQLGAPLGNVSYHVRQLADLGLITLVRQTPVRGTLEHYYRAEIRPGISGQAFDTVPDLVKEATLRSTLGQIAEAVNRGAEEGGFGREDAHLSRFPLVLDDEGWTEVSRELESLVERVDKIQRASGRRLLKADHQGELRGELVTMLFEAGEAAKEAPRARRQIRRRSRSGSRS